MALIAISIVRNEADRYLTNWLNNVRTYADRHVVLDDASDDATVAILRERALRDPALVVDVGLEPWFVEREQDLRARLWELTRTIADSGDWIIVVDADEFYDSELLERKPGLLALPDRQRLLQFRFLDLWLTGWYRADGYWSPRAFFRMFRFEDQPFVATQTGLNASPLPLYVREIVEQDRRSNIYRTEIRCLHKGYLRESDRRRKYAFYLEHLEHPFDRQHVRSILEVPPRLKPCRHHRSPAEIWARRVAIMHEAVASVIRPGARFARQVAKGAWPRL